MKTPKLLQHFLALVFINLLWAPMAAQAQSDPMFTISATPLHPAFGEDVTVTITARSNAGLYSASFSMERQGVSAGYDISVSKEGEVVWDWIGPDYWRIASEDRVPLQFTKDFRQIGSPFEDTFVVTIPAEEWARGYTITSLMLRIQARVVDMGGQSETQTVSMAAGTWPAQFVIPIWWRGETPDQVHMAYVADGADYATGHAMLPEIEDLVFGRVYENNEMRRYNDRFSLWYVSEPGFIDRTQTNGRAFQDPPWLDPMALTQVRYRVYTHNTPWRDRASGRRFSTDVNYPGTYVHEIGHSVFHLSDEYCGGGQLSPEWIPNPSVAIRSEPMPHNNAFKFQLQCHAYAISEGYDINECQRLCGESTWWRLQAPGGTTAERPIMRDSFDLRGVPQFLRASPKRIDWYLNTYIKRQWPWP